MAAVSDLNPAPPTLSTAVQALESDERTPRANRLLSSGILGINVTWLLEGQVSTMREVGNDVDRIFRGPNTLSAMIETPQSRSEQVDDCAAECRRAGGIEDLTQHHTLGVSKLTNLERMIEYSTG